MKNNYGLDPNELMELRKKSKLCVYCRKLMMTKKLSAFRKEWATIEHLNRFPPWNNIKTVVFCCWSCNSSRGNKKIIDWLNSEYCSKRNIKYKNISKSVKKYIDTFER